MNGHDEEYIEPPVSVLLDLVRARLPLTIPRLMEGDGSDFTAIVEHRGIRVSRFTLLDTQSGRLVAVEGETWHDSEPGLWQVTVEEVEPRAGTE